MGTCQSPIWDAERGRLLLGRDRLGIKPLFYAGVSDTVVFASELKAVLAHPDVRREIDPQALDLYQRASEQAASEESKVTLMQIANEERAHLEQLGKLFEKL